MDKFKGLGTSSEISIAKVFIYKEVELRIKKTQIVDSSVEIYRLESALHKSIGEIEKIYEITLATIGEEEAELFIAHRMILEILENYGEGVGLYRTEFLYMDKDRLPTEEEQFQSYRIVADKLGKLPLVIRTLDVGGDKDLPFLDLPNETNPFLGYRAIRLSLDRLDIFKTQLRAILRASVFGNIKIMFPMISNIKEIRDAKAIIEEIKAE